MSQTLAGGTCSGRSSRPDGYMSGQHKLLSPSKGAMWMRCLGALAFGRDAPNVPSWYAAEGTAYHTVSAETLLHGGECSDWIGRTVEADGFKFVIDSENASFAQVYVNRIRAIPGRRFVEVKLDLSALLGIKDQGGTGDSVIFDRANKTLHSDDLKFGRGEVVYAKQNEQLMLYATAAVYKYEMLGITDDWQVKMAIHQPRVDHYDEWRCSVAELREWTVEAARLAQQAYGIYQRNDMEEILRNLTPGAKQCRWCPMDGKCPERTKEMLASFPLADVQQLAQKRATMTDAEIAEAWLRTDDVEKWISAVRAEALSRALNGASLPGLKLSQGRRGNRKFKDSVKAEAIMTGAIGDKAYEPRQLISPTEAQRQLKDHKEVWDLLNGRITDEAGNTVEDPEKSLIIQSEGAKTLVRIEDPRPPVPITTVEFPVQSPATKGLL